MSDLERDAFRIGHMLEACRKARKFAGTDRDEFWHSEMRQAATVRAIQILGEAAKLVSPEVQYRFAEVPWRGMAGMRNVIVHEYFDVQLEVVWEVVSERLEELEDNLAKILAKLDVE